MNKKALNKLKLKKNVVSNLQKTSVIGGTGANSIFDCGTGSSGMYICFTGCGTNCQN